jgi:hypothetical protein
MLTACLLIAFGVLCRLMASPMVWNVPYMAVPLGAIALYAAARLPRLWAFAVPVAVLGLSDLVIDPHHAYAFWALTRGATYATFLLVVAAGRLAPARAGLPARLGMAVGAATFFFLVSNFLVWLTNGGYGHPQTLAGLMSTYADGIPFYRRELVADLIGVAVLFGVVDALVDRVRAAEPAKITE